MTPEELLVFMLHMSDEQLLKFAPEATHQHFKGGLYKLLGRVMDAETGKPYETPGAWLIEPDGYVAYLHLYPHERQVWIRKSSEFYGPKDGGLRFRPLTKS